MKNYIEITNELFEKREKYLIAQKNKRAKIIKISSVACSFVAVCLIGVGIRQSDLLKPKDTGSDLPEGFVQVQPNDYIPEQSQPKPDTQTSDTNTQIKEPDLSSPEDKPAVKPDNNTDTEIKQPDVSLEAITPPIVGDRPLNTDDNVISTTIYEPLKFEIDDDFSPYEVVVTLTEEESKIDQVYTTDYFPQVDIYHIGLYDEYYYNNFYRIDMYSGFEKLRTIILQLNNPSKETVLEYCDLLEKDERVLYARPNVNTELKNILKVYPAKELRSYPWNISKEDFPEFEDIQDIRRDDPYIYIYFKSADQKYMREQFKKAMNCKNIDYVELVHVQYNESYVHCYITEERLNSVKDITVDDFEGLDLKDVQFCSGTQASGSYYILMFKDCDKRNIVDAKKILSKKPIVKKIWIYDSTLLPKFNDFVPDIPEAVITPDTPY